jgi:hypothetical protein
MWSGHSAPCSATWLMCPVHRMWSGHNKTETSGKCLRLVGCVCVESSFTLFLFCFCVVLFPFCALLFLFLFCQFIVAVPAVFQFTSSSTKSSFKPRRNCTLRCTANVCMYSLLRTCHSVTKYYCTFVYCSCNRTSAFHNDVMWATVEQRTASVMLIRPFTEI